MKHSEKDEQPIFIDLIIKIMLCRVYVNIKDRKLLTAEKILGNAETLIDYIQMNKLEIITNPEIRGESNHYDFSILKKKYLMQKGILLFSLNKEIDAQDVFLNCMESNDGNFDPRILKDCIVQIMNIQQKKGRQDMYTKAK